MKNRLWILLAMVMTIAVLPVNVKAAQDKELKVAMEKTAKTSLSDWLFADLNGDGKNEALATYFDKKDVCHVIFSDSNGNCSDIKQVKYPKDTVQDTFINEIEEGKYSNAAVSIGSFDSGLQESFIIGMEGKKPVILFEGNGYINQYDDDLVLTTDVNEKSYDAKKEEFSGNSTRLTYVEKSEDGYRELPGKRVNGYDRYENFDEVKKLIEKNVDDGKFAIKYVNLDTIVRPNGKVVIGAECVFEDGGAVFYYYRADEKYDSKSGKYVLKPDINLGKTQGRAVIATQYKAPKKAEKLNMMAISSDQTAALFCEGPSYKILENWGANVYLAYNDKLIMVPNGLFAKYGMDAISVETSDYDGDGETEVAIGLFDEGGTGHMAEDLTIFDNIENGRMDVYIYNVDYEEEYDYSDDFGLEDKIGDKVTMGYETINPTDMLTGRLKTQLSKDKHKLTVSDKKTGKELGFLKNTKDDMPLDKVAWIARTEISLENGEIHFILEPADSMGLVIPDSLSIDYTVKYKGDGKIEIDSVKATPVKWDANDN